MAQSPKNGDNKGDSAVSGSAKEFVKTLTAEHRMLIVLKSQLYEGSWKPMLDDLQNRLTGKPYIFKLAGRINDDIQRIQQMQQFEKDHNLNLADYVDSVE